MTEPIRVLHFADAHVGMENYGRMDPDTGTSSRVRDFLDRLDEVIDFAIEHDGDLAVFAGDAFKNRDPEPTQQREFAQRVKRLADHMPTLLLVGNHDMPGMAAKASSVDIFQALDVRDVIVGHKAEGRVVETKRGPLYLAWIPYPMRNRLLTREENAGKTIDELEQALRRTVAEILADLAEDARQQPMPRLLAGHLSVAEAKLGSERTVMLGRDVAVMTSTLNDAAWDYVALGHIHKHQVLNPRGYPQVVYSGSLERIDFGEEDEPKGFCWVELAREATRWTFQPVSARPFRTVSVDVREQVNPTAAVLSAVAPVDVAGAIVRVLVILRADQQALLIDREIEAALDGASSVTLSRQVQSEARARLGETAFESLTPLQLVEQYFRTRAEEPARVEALLQKAEELLDEETPEPSARRRAS